MDNMKVEGTREERRERVRQLREAFAQLRRWNDPSKLPNKAEAQGFRAVDSSWPIRRSTSVCIPGLEPSLADDGRCARAGEGR